MAGVPQKYLSEIREERRLRDRFMATHAESPFVDGSVAGFRGLSYFPVDPKWVIRGRLERTEPPREAYLRTSRDGQLELRCVGNLTFTLFGKPMHLRAYHTGATSSLFVPFRDRTSGRESYGPGRYLTLDMSTDDEYAIDFNRAFNPYCAYTPAYECGFPPPENDLPVAIRAGEKAWIAGPNPRTPNAAIRALLPPPRPTRAPGARPAPRAKGKRSRSLPR